jgi:hypothetical protein
MVWELLVRYSHKLVMTCGGMRKGNYRYCTVKVLSHNLTSNGVLRALQLLVYNLIVKTVSKFVSRLAPNIYVQYSIK